MRPIRSWRAVLAASAALLGCVVAAAAAAPYIPWPSALPGLPTARNPQPGPLPGCKRPSLACIDRNLARLKTIVGKLGCDHQGVFATTYQKTTETVRASVVSGRPRFRDRGWIIDIDVLFHDYYYRALADYGASHAVPVAWKIAFDTAARGDANATKDMLLGVNAHVQRDLPYVLATLGLHTRAGASRKRDWDDFNIVLNDSYDPVVKAVTSRFDPSVALTNPDTVIDGEAGLQLFEAWREVAFRHAEQLLNARTASRRRAVERSIESAATVTARKITAIPEYPGYRAQRDAYCAAHS
jgi:hypothetical protein